MLRINSLRLWLCNLTMIDWFVINSLISYDYCLLINQLQHMLNDHVNICLNSSSVHVMSPPQHSPVEMKRHDVICVEATLYKLRLHSLPTQWLCVKRYTTTSIPLSLSPFHPSRQEYCACVHTLSWNLTCPGAVVCYAAWIANVWSTISVSIKIISI